MTDSIHTITPTPQEQAAYTSGWNRALEAAAEAVKQQEADIPIKGTVPHLTLKVASKAIRALSMPAPAQAWRVKPLEWQRRDDHRWAADAMHRMIYITEYAGMSEPFQLDMRGHDAPMFATLEAAKAAAQQDYETRILAALIPDTEGGA